MASGRVIDIKWIHEGKLYAGNICTVQGKLDCSRVTRLDIHRINLPQVQYNN